MEIFSKSFKMKNKSFLLIQERLAMVEATGICRFRFAEPRQGVVAPSIFVLFSTTICGRSSREPTVIRAFRETRRRNKKITDSRLAIRYFWLRQRDLNPIPIR